MIFLQILNSQFFQVMGHDKWYFPMMSKQDLLRQSSDILGQPLDKITHEFDQAQDLSFHKKACIQAIWEGLSPIIMGHGGKRTTYNLSPTDWTNFNILGYEKSWFGGNWSHIRKKCVHNFFCLIKKNFFFDLSKNIRASWHTLHYSHRQ